MILALSSEAAPTASLADLVDGCARRGINALHLVDGHAHRISISTRAVPQMQGVRIAAFELRSTNGIAPEAAAALSMRLDCLVTAPDATPEWLAGVNRSGGKSVRRFELNAAAMNVAEAAMIAGAPPEHIILRGGGPEAAQYEGRGIGALMARLSLAGYAGTIALAPTSKAVLPVWNAWLNHGRGWGCGSKTSDPSLVQLG